QSGVNSFAGSLAAYGGAGAMTGGAGTVYTELTGQNGLLVFDNGGQVGTNSLVSVTSSSIDVLIRGNAGVIRWKSDDCFQRPAPGLLRVITLHPERQRQRHDSGRRQPARRQRGLSRRGGQRPWSFLQ